LTVGPPAAARRARARREGAEPGAAPPFKPPRAAVDADQVRLLPALLLAVLLAAILPAGASAACTKRGRAHARRCRAPVRHHPKKPATATPGLLVLSAPLEGSPAPYVPLDQPCAGEDLFPTLANLPAVAAATLCLVDQQREAAGLYPLASNPLIALGAAAHDTDMIVRDYFSHVAPGGGTLLSRLIASGYITGAPGGYILGENLAWGTNDQSTPKAVVAAWMKSPDHRANILDPTYRETGIAVLPLVPASADPSGAAGATYTEDFATDT
jgi:uncharacterized protein YkwD